jgi:hypothetical protein
MTDPDQDEDGELPDDDTLAEIEAHVLWKKLVAPHLERITRAWLTEVFVSLAGDRVGARSEVEAMITELLPAAAEIGANDATLGAFVRLYRRFAFRSAR